MGAEAKEEAGGGKVGFRGRGGLGGLGGVDGWGGEWFWRRWGGGWCWRGVRGLVEKWGCGRLLRFSMLILPISYFVVLVLSMLRLERSRVRPVPLWFSLVDKASWPRGETFDPMVLVPENTFCPSDSASRSLDSGNN